MNYPVEILGGTVEVVASIAHGYSAGCDSLRLECGAFMLVVGFSPQARKALIAALQEADAELDAAAEARQQSEEVA